MHNIMSGCGKDMGLFYGILSVPHNIVMDLNNVMWSLDRHLSIFGPTTYPKIIKDVHVRGQKHQTTTATFNVRVVLRYTCSY